MYTAWLFFEDQFRDVFFPEQSNWTSQIVLSQFDTGWGFDAVFPVRLLDDRLFLTIPREFRWQDAYAQPERQVPPDAYFQLIRKSGGRAVNVIFRRLDRG